jgi:hypothetical protein
MSTQQYRLKINGETLYIERDTDTPPEDAGSFRWSDLCEQCHNCGCDDEYVFTYSKGRPGLRCMCCDTFHPAHPV